MIHVLSVDVEEYFHASEVQLSVSSQEWETLASRVNEQVDVVLELLAAHDTLATFFILGWVAERYPAMVRKIVDQGHEIGCHSYAHRLVYSLTPEEFRQDTLRAMKAIEDACGIVPRLYRAPSYSITRQSFWALDILAECGFTHDSSVYPIHHDRYGIPGFSRTITSIATPSGPIQEVPIATAKLASNRIVPIGGGGYMRLLPYQYTAAGIRRLTAIDSIPACIYFHPWELDANQPKVASGLVSRLRTYAGLGGMKTKLSRLLREFSFSTLTNVYPEAHLAADRNGYSAAAGR